MSSKIGSLQVTERKIGLVHWSKKVGETENGLFFFILRIAMSWSVIRFYPAHFDEFFIKLLEKIQDNLGNWSRFALVVTGSFRIKGNCRSELVEEEKRRKRGERG